MGNRLSKIVTRTGDAGNTGLGDGSRIGKDSLRIDVIGEVDELNSFIGVLLSEDIPDGIHDILLAVQHDLFDIGGEVCIPTGYTAIQEEPIERLEASVEEINGTLTPLKEFILPGGTRPAALAHLARSVCRRVERRIVRLANSEPVSENIRKYFNRLSDLLFVLGRALNKAGGRGDVPWDHKRVKKPRD
jgi:cob(I)alamin adenosyltransferase